MAFGQVGIFPLLSVAFALLAFFIGYAIALSKDHIDAWLPFISDCGALTPESNIFGQLLNVCALFLLNTFYLVHRNTVCFYQEMNVKMGAWKTFSLLLMLLGWVAAAGASGVANFPESQQLTAHTVNAFLFFIGILFYLWGQLILAYSLKPKIVPIHLTNFRLLLTFSSSLVLIFHMICLFGQPFVKRIDGKLPPKPDWPGNIERPSSSSPYYDNHIAAALSEWILALLLLLHLLTYTYDFALVELHSPDITRNESRPIDTVSEDSLAKDNLRLHQYGIDAYSAPVLSADRYSETTSHRRLPRIDQIYPNGGSSAAYSNRLPRPSIQLSPVYSTNQY